MTVDELTVADELTAARLEWLDAEARLAELLPGEGEPQVDHDDVPVAVENSERAHAAYLSAVRRWAGLTDT